LHHVSNPSEGKNPNICDQYHANGKKEKSL